MKMLKLSGFFVFASLVIIAGCGSEGGGSDDPGSPNKDPKDPPAAFLEINNNVYIYKLPGGSKFNSILSPNVVITKTFPCNIDEDNNHDEITDVVNVPAGFIMGETEVTYELWYEVYKWATTDYGAGKRVDGGVLYSFANAGREGNDGIVAAVPSDDRNEPVTQINWRDAMIWCNALTEYYNSNNGTSIDLLPVYCIDVTFETPIRTSTNSTEITWEYNVGSYDGKEDDPYVNPLAKGFRLPTSIEWEFAARYIGNDLLTNTNYTLMDDIYYAKGNGASGASVNCNYSSETSAVAVYDAVSTAIVKSKKS